MNPPSFPVIAVILVFACGCRLERRSDLLGEHYLVARNDNTVADQEHLEQEYQRELAHLRQINAEIAALHAEEEELSYRAEEARARNESLRRDIEAAEEERARAAERLQSVRAEIEALIGQADAERTPVTRDAIRARIAALEAALERMKSALDALPEAETDRESPPESDGRAETESESAESGPEGEDS